MNATLMIDLLRALVKSVMPKELWIGHQDAVSLYFIVEMYHTACTEKWDYCTGYANHLEYFTFCGWDLLRPHGHRPDDIRKILRMGKTLFTIVSNMEENNDG